jgi:hypothetical protein
LCNAKAVFTDSAMKRSFGDFLGLHFRKMKKLQVSIIGVSIYCCILKNKKMNHQQLEKIFGPPIMNQAIKPIMAQRPQINIVQVLIALGIGYFFLKGVKYFIL